LIPVIDIFAGPGGLGEGFSSWRDAKDRPRFALAASFEKDPAAHTTLRLRAFQRQFGSQPPRELSMHFRRGLTWDALAAAYPRQAVAADREALLMELGPQNVATVRRHISSAVPADDPWILIGGPPCQAYSIAGRSRNMGKADYEPDLDRRQTLYVEYLQVLADHAPQVFVMENVKGLLSAQLNRQGMFDRILEDLADPGRALKREGRTGRRRPRYSIRSLNGKTDLLGFEPSDYVVRAEDFGVPQRRHRVILVGVLDQAGLTFPNEVRGPYRPKGVRAAIDDLPRVRSGLTDELDSDKNWLDRLKQVRGEPWLKSMEAGVRRRLLESVDRANVPAASRGAEALARPDGSVVFNHSTRAHINSDLQRYLFASSFAAENGTSPRLGDFPPTLLPAHANVRMALKSRHFSDRFRVQVGSQPATTITSHISKDGHYYIHYDPTQCRSLTVREAARLQTFPDDYFFCGGRTKQYQQVGNAVPPRLAQHIAAFVASAFE
jgi:DNA (cytosine-5)-methyltransferase 1